MAEDPAVTYSQHFDQLWQIIKTPYKKKLVWPKLTIYGHKNHYLEPGGGGEGFNLRRQKQADLCEFEAT